MPTKTTEAHFCDRCGAEIPEPKIPKIGNVSLTISWTAQGNFARVGGGYNMLCRDCTTWILNVLAGDKNW